MVRKKSLQELKPFIVLLNLKNIIISQIWKMSEKIIYEMSDNYKINRW